MWCRSFGGMFSVKLIRACVAAAIVSGSITAAVNIIPTAAGAVITAPYTALTMNGAAGSYLLPDGGYVFTPANATINANGIPASFGITATLPASPPHDSFSGDTQWQATMQAPTGSTFAVGSYPTLRAGDATHATLDLAVGSRGCGSGDGTLNVEQVTYNPAKTAMTSFAASYRFSCGTTGSYMTGDIRMNSTIGYSGAVTSPFSVDFGAQSLNTSGTPYAVRVDNNGTAPLTLGSAGFTGANAAWFTSSSDNCSGMTIAVGGTCQVVVVPDPTQALGTAALVIPVPGNAVTPQLTVALTVHGTTAPPASATGGPGFVDLNWGQLPADGDVGWSGYSIDRGTSPTSLTHLASLAYNIGHYHDTAVIPGTAYYYAIEPIVAGVATMSNPLVDAVPWQLGGPGTFISLTPARVLDTRVGNGAPTGAVGPGGTLHLQVGGRGGVPANGAGSVELNLTATGPTTSTYLTAYPTGQPRPLASVLNVVAGQTKANLITVPLGTGGQVDLYNAAGRVNMVADVVGYYANAVTTDSINSGGQYQPFEDAQRISDTRSGSAGPLPGGYEEQIPLNFTTAASPHVRAVAVNITAVGATGPGYLTAWNGVDQLPDASTLNFTANSVVSNMSIVPVAPCTFDPSCNGLPQIGVFNGSGRPVHVIVDLVGFVDDDTLIDGTRYLPLNAPRRIVDTRTGLGIAHAIGSAQTAQLDPGTLADLDTLALNLNVTAVAPTSNTYLTIWPSIPNLGKPATSSVNATPGAIVPSHVLPATGLNNIINIFNAAGSTNVVIDINGIYETWPEAPAPPPFSPGAGQAAQATRAVPRQPNGPGRLDPGWSTRPALSSHRSP